MMIKISDGCYVSADQIAKLTVKEYSHTIIVRTKDGIGHCHEPGYGQSVYDALDDLVKQVNQATAV